MSNKVIILGEKAREGIVRGVNDAVDAISRTLGPAGKAVVIAADFGAPEITRDGASVAKSIQFKDDVANQGAQLIRKAASLTEDQAGDGPQPLYAKVLTPTGWVEMGSLKIGQKICGTDRTIQEVVAVYPKGKKEVYKVHFSTGQVVECCEDHLWQVNNNVGEGKVMTLKEIIEHFENHESFFVPNTIVDFVTPNTATTLDPNLLGMFIGRKIGVVGEDRFTGLNTDKSIETINHIPNEFLYSDFHTRYKLYEGIVTTIYKDKGVFVTKVGKELEDLVDDLVELFYGLGKTLYKQVDQDGDFHLTEVYTCDLGREIVKIEKTGKMEEMQCIKVSNEDNLYITNDYIVTHNTSTTSVLTKELCNKGMESTYYGSNMNEVKSGMLKAQKWITNYISKNSIQIDGDLEKIRKVATISANNDPEIGDLIVSCMEKVGVDGVITSDFSSGLDTTIEVTTGLKIERGWASPQYVTSPEEGICVMEEPYILVAGERVSSVSQIMNLMGVIAKSGRPLLFICDDMDDVVNSTIVINTLQGAIRCCVVKGIDFGDGRKNIMQDISIATGADFICKENSLELSKATVENLGSARKVIVSRDNTLIFEGFGDKTKIEERANVLKKLLKSDNTTKYDKIKFEKRIANLSGGIGVIKAGGATEVEKQNRKATIDDAILASKSAIEEGCCPGGGYIYFKASKEIENDKAFWNSLKGDEETGAKIVIESLPTILKTVVENSGHSSVIVAMNLERKSNFKKADYGFNAKTGKYCSLVEEGILDSAKVLRVALENSISTASMILLADCLIIEDTEDKKGGDTNNLFTK